MTISSYAGVNKMDDLQFRRSIFADPNTSEKDIIEACKEDPAKEKLIEEMQALDDKLKLALDIDIPENLCHDIILNQTLSEHKRTKRKGRTQLAMAASVAFAVGLMFNNMQSSPAFENIGDQALAHVYHEQNSYQNNSSAKVSLASLNELMTGISPNISATFGSEVGELISARYCKFGGVKSLHLVFKGATEIVTVFILPNVESMPFVDSFTDDNLQGIVKQYNNANIIVIADKNEPVKKWLNNIDREVTWSI